MGVRKPPIPHYYTILAPVIFSGRKAARIFSGKEVNPVELEVRTPDGVKAAHIEAIVRLLEKADFRQLRLVWVYASHLIG